MTLGLYKIYTSNEKQGHLIQISFFVHHFLIERLSCRRVVSKKKTTKVQVRRVIHSYDSK